HKFYRQDGSEEQTVFLIRQPLYRRVSCSLSVSFGVEVFNGAATRSAPPRRILRVTAPLIPEYFEVTGAIYINTKPTFVVFEGS
ncbi:MAG: hypothetical protein VXZ25_03510, partial [Pseudomonadota bacterium]|nr:hypothetical protein [Pseudomonadota bacterium]